MSQHEADSPSDPVSGERVEANEVGGYVRVRWAAATVTVEVGWEDEAMCAVDLNAEEAERLRKLLEPTP